MSSRRTKLWECRAHEIHSQSSTRRANIIFFRRILLSIASYEERCILPFQSVTYGQKSAKFAKQERSKVQGVTLFYRMIERWNYGMVEYPTMWNTLLEETKVSRK